mmetsp:Transcript_9884/g.19605  ORF Transcript_9884/g.19605 Transcript_9884/m.19605 type:complete len:139 (+) Transcript_9884:3588-4004(+)
MKPVRLASFVLTHSPKLKRRTPTLDLSRRRNPYSLSRPVSQSMPFPTHYNFITPQKTSLPVCIPRISLKSRRRNRSVGSSVEIVRTSSILPCDLQPSVTPKHLYTAKYSHKHTSSLHMGDADRRLAKFYEDACAHLCN